MPWSILSESTSKHDVILSFQSLYYLCARQVAVSMLELKATLGFYEISNLNCHAHATHLPKRFESIHYVAGVELELSPNGYKLEPQKIVEDCGLTDTVPLEERYHRVNRSFVTTE